MRINIIYLAAGNSRRFGSNKLLAVLNGKYLYRFGLEAVVKAAQRHDGWRIFLVSRYREVLEDAAGLPVVPVYSPKSTEGMSRSIQAGIEAGEKEGADYYGFLVADQPYIRPDTLERFFAGMERGGHRLGCVCYNGQDGNPTCFHREYLPGLLALEGDQGGKRVMRRESAIWRFEAAEARELEDIDFFLPD